MDKAREGALKILYKIENQQAYSNIVLDEYLTKERQKLNPKDIALLSELVYGVVNWKMTLDAILQKYSKIKVKKISKWLLNILRMGIYQIVFLDRIPKAAAVNESVNLAKRYAPKSLAFANAILRKVEKEDYEEIKQIKDKKERDSKQYSMPVWLIEKLIEQYGEEGEETICKALNEKAKTTIRVNSLKIHKEQLEELLEQRNIAYEETELEEFLIVNNMTNMASLDLFQKGFFMAQDLGAGKISKALAPKPGEKVLDACSAPGGKATHLAELMQNQGEIEAWDLYAQRIELIRQNVERLGITIIKPRVKNVLEVEEEAFQSFDKILLDVPCLGIGVIKRKPDIKWQRNKEDILEITEIQLDMLRTCSKYLKIGGELVYSTCSLLKEENQYIVDEFLGERDVEGCRNREKFTKIYQEVLLPGKNTDGFFICKLKRLA